MHYNGIGVESQDYFEALRRFKEAAELGNVSAQCNLAMMHKNGQGTNRYLQTHLGFCDFSRDMNVALKYYQAAANQGDSGLPKRNI